MAKAQPVPGANYRGGGWYILPNGDQVRGKAAVLAAQDSAIKNMSAGLFRWVLLGFRAEA